MTGHILHINLYINALPIVLTLYII